MIAAIALAAIGVAATALAVAASFAFAALKRADAAADARAFQIRAEGQRDTAQIGIQRANDAILVVAADLERQKIRANTLEEELKYAEAYPHVDDIDLPGRARLRASLSAITSVPGVSSAPSSDHRSNLPQPPSAVSASGSIGDGEPRDPGDTDPGR